MHKTINDIISKKNKGEKISVVTSYDYSFATICDRAGIDILLVGDSAGMVMLGYENTIPVSMEQMCIFTEAVSRARKNSLIVADLPFLSYQSSIREAITNAGKLIKAGADAVKLEGGSVMANTIRAITSIGIPVMGHIGLQPQTTTLTQGYSVQGKTSSSAKRLIEDAKSVERAGAFSLVLEMTTCQVSKIITDTVKIPTIGIGSGVDCDGQVLVIHDLLGLYDKVKPKFVKKYLSLSDEISDAVMHYRKDIESGKFPEKENTFSMEEEELQKLNGNV